ncbi:hypothetical protein FOL47_002767 [Perkinsus chesapeaki]|uniref:Uncharacterized protein n=1 Tax=Perkinsus chesapeaki TaxID=330153 RepID=A0A7J6N0R5_PERCH|nr:hypothetical protein FOL47_002767 [Perkinsus chesapeaki]
MLKALEHRYGGVLPGLILDTIWSFARLIIPKIIYQEECYVLGGLNYLAADTLNRKLLGVRCNEEVVSLPMDDLEGVPTQLAPVILLRSACITDNGLVCYTQEDSVEVYCMNLREGDFNSRPETALPEVPNSPEWLRLVSTRDGWLFSISFEKKNGISLYGIKAEGGEAWTYITTIDRRRKNVDRYTVENLDVDFATSDPDPTKILILYRNDSDDSVHFRNLADDSLSSDIEIKHNRESALIPGSGGITCVAVFMGDDERFHEELGFVNDWIGIWVVDPQSGVVLHRTGGYSTNIVEPIIATNDWDIFMPLVPVRDVKGDGRYYGPVYHLKLIYE